MPEISSSKYLVQAGWDHVPHLDEQTKAELLASTPENEKDARTKGKPSLGTGAIYPVPEEDVLCAPFPIPRHWPRVYALDPGWRVTAVLWGALDRESDCWYLYTEHYRGKADPATHAAAIKARGEWIPGLIDPAPGTNLQDGERMMAAYQAQGLNLIPANNAVEAGIYETWLRLSTGRLKVFNTLQHWLAEYRLYRREERVTDVARKAVIVKKNDHLMDCWDSETEVLTRDGWKPWPEASGSDDFATVNLATDEIEYQQPTEMISRSYVGQMVRIDGRKLDAMMTPAHRMVVYRRGREEPEIVLAKDLSIWDRIKLRAKWIGEQRAEPIEVGVRYGHTATIDPLVWAEFLGWYVAEGSRARTIQIPGRGYQVVVSQIKPESTQSLNQLLAQTPWRWRYDGQAFMTSCKWLWSYIDPLGVQSDRYVPQWVKDSSVDVIEAFLRGAIAGDGWVQGKTRTYATISRRLADDVQELFFKIGKNASVRVGRRAGQMTMRGQAYTTREQYWVAEWNKPYGLLRDRDNVPNFSKVRYSGRVYCATVPNGTLVVRRNGKPMIAGNCMRYIVMSGESRAVPEPAPGVGLPGASTAGGDRRAGY